MHFDILSIDCRMEIRKVSEEIENPVRKFGKSVGKLGNPFLKLESQ
jgi:hypothetical protein